MIGGLKTIISSQQDYHVDVTAVGCHLDRSATEKIVVRKIFGAEWRDPETLSYVMQLRGILPRLAVVSCLARQRAKVN